MPSEGQSRRTASDVRTHEDDVVADLLRYLNSLGYSYYAEDGTIVVGKWRFSEREFRLYPMEYSRTLMAIISEELAEKYPKSQASVVRDILDVDEKLSEAGKSTTTESEPPLREPSIKLAELGRVLGEIAVLQETAQSLVDEARRQGATWAEIGDVYGASSQAAYQRWSPRGREKHAGHQRAARGRQSDQE